MMNSIKNFIELTRAYALLITFAPILVIYSYAKYSESFTFLNLFLLTLAIAMVHLGANLFDDFIDVKLQLKKGIELKDVSFPSFFNKARLIKDGTYSFWQIEQILAILFTVPLIIGIYFAVISTPYVLLFALFGAILTLFYPISSRYYMAEITVGLIYGPLVIMGGYMALTNSFDINLIFPSAAIFFTTIILLHVHSIMDFEFDIKTNKNSLAILSKSKTNAITVLKILITLSYLVVLVGILLLRLNPKTLYVFLTLPIAVKLIESITDYINIKDIEFIPRWYYGFFENWDEIKKNHLAFFMYRFYLARNYAFFFALFLAIGAMI